MPRKLVFNAWRDRFGSPGPFVFELDKQHPAAIPRRSNGIHISKAVAGAFGDQDEPEHLQAFNQIAREFVRTFVVSVEAMRIRLWMECASRCPQLVIQLTGLHLQLIVAEIDIAAKDRRGETGNHVTDAVDAG